MTIIPAADSSNSLLGRHRQLAPSASVRVSPLCLGAMAFGGRQEETYGECSKEDAFSILDHFYSQGGNFIDTANVYQQGQSEVWLGEWMAAHDNRDEIVLATKYSSGYMLAEKGKNQTNYCGNSTKSMKVSVEDSLKKLQTSYIDILYVHWWDYTTTIAELMHSLNDLCVAGKVLYLGISNAPAWIVTKANQYARDHGLRQFVIYQGMWSVAVRDFERDIIPMCRDEGMAIAPYGVYGNGRIKTEEGFKEREKQDYSGRKMLAHSERDRQVSKSLEKIANAKEVPITSVALAYIIQKAPYVFPIVGSRKLEHIKGSQESLSVSLTDEEIKEIEHSYDFDHGYPHTYLSGSMLWGNDKPWPAQGPADVWLTKTFGGTVDWVESVKPIRPKQQ